MRQAVLQSKTLSPDESPFLDQELLVKSSEEEWEPRAAALASESPFLQLNEEVTEAERFATVEEAEESPASDQDAEALFELEEPRAREDHSEAEHDSPDAGVTESEAEDAADHGVEDGRLFEAFVPKVSQAEVRNRIDEYFRRANADYTIPAHTLPDGTTVAGSTVKARPQFRYARMDSEAQKKAAITRIKRIVGSSLDARHVKAIGKAVYGRPKPSNIAAITQALINKGELDAVRLAQSTLTNSKLVRALQSKFKVGIDCAGYVQLAFIFAYTGSDDDPPRLRKKLGLHQSRGEERLRSLPAAHFTKVPTVDARTGDLFVLEAQADSTDHAWHTVIVVDHTVSGTIHTFLVDASWGTDLYGTAAGGVRRRRFQHDTTTGMWWDISPATRTVCGVAVTKGDKACENPIGPYNRHPPHGVFRPKEKT